MTYSRASELFKKAVTDEGLDAKKYGLHSLRSGGATTAAALGVPERLLQRQDGWRTAKAKNNYILESKSALLHVIRRCKALNLYVLYALCVAADAAATPSGV